MIISGDLPTNTPLPSMRALTKTAHVIVITVKAAYENLQRDGFINTAVGRGSFVSAQNKDFVQNEQRYKAEEFLLQAAEIGSTFNISLDTLIEMLKIFYQGEDKA